jgi:ATP-dependent protease HslVU (ClpYQ) peptidase subunit
VENDREKIKDAVANLRRIYSNEQHVIALLSVLDNILNYTKSLEDRLENRCDDLEDQCSEVAR